jgi:hypothetical protein
LLRARTRAADHRGGSVVQDRALEQRRVLGQDRGDLVDAEPVGVQPELLVALVAPDQRVGRIADQARRERAQFVLRQPLGDQQVLRAVNSRPARDSASNA